MTNRIDRVGLGRGWAGTGFTPAWRRRLVKAKLPGKGLSSEFIANAPFVTPEDNLALNKDRLEKNIEIEKARSQFDAEKIALSLAVSEWLFAELSVTSTSCPILEMTAGPETIRNPVRGWMVPAHALEQYVWTVSEITLRRYPDKFDRPYDFIDESNLVVVGPLNLHGLAFAKFALTNCLALGEWSVSRPALERIIFENVTILSVHWPKELDYQKHAQRITSVSEALNAVTGLANFRARMRAEEIGITEGDLQIESGKTELDYLFIHNVRANEIVMREAAIRTLDCVNVSANFFNGNSLTCASSLAFAECKFGSVLLSDTQVSGDVAIQLTTISDGFDCQNAKIGRSAKFLDVDFGTAPNFHGCEFPSDTEFHRCNFGGRPARTSDTDDLLAERGAYRALRVAMNRAKATETELYFYELEQRAGQHLLEYRKAPITKILSLIYDKVSSYGTDPGRALKWFCGWNLASLVLFWVLHVYGPFLHQNNLPSLAGYTLGFAARPPALKVEPGSTFDGKEGIGLAVQNAINPLALATHNPMVKIQNGSLFLLSVIQSIGSAGIVTLFLLAVRNRFQRSGGGSSG